MIPSRGPIQVSLDDSDSRIRACKPPVVQVKILRRPKSSADNMSNNHSSNLHNQLGEPKFNAASVFDETLSNESTSRDNSNIINDSSGSFMDIGLRSQHFPPLTSNSSFHSPANNMISNNDNNNIYRQQQSAPTLAIHQHHSNTINKIPLKSYKERADEYAKARLRILGSASSEDDNHNSEDGAF